LNFLDRFLKIHPVVAKLYANSQMDMRKLIDAFCSLVNMHKNHMRMLIDATFSISYKS